MTLLPFRFPLSAVIGSLALTTSIAFALNAQNAGPDQFEIKFKLPPPKPLTPAEALASFKVAPGFKVELVAAEPLVEAPISMSWDDQGRLFVLEMRGYMHDVDGKGEDQPLGRIVVLEDTDGDGKMDKRTVFADGLVLPRALMCVNGGVLVAEPPTLWFMKDTDGNGKADVKEVVDSSYGTRNGQPEHMANSPTWCLDNWIYNANHGTRYRLKDGKFIAESAPTHGQWGMTQDDYGRLFYNFNSDFLRASLIPENLYKRNPNFPASAGMSVQVMKDQKTWPSHPTPGVNRGYDGVSLREDGTLTTCTATCGAGIYRASLFPKEFQGNAFIPEPAGNLVKRVIIDEKDGKLTGHNAYQETEFLTSTDERFRPVNAYTGPDGALYLVDMYRGIIQHKGFLTHYLIANIKDRKLEEPIDQGRIWRIVPDGTKPTPVKLPKESAKLVPFLGSDNGWVRDTAQRVLVERKDAQVVPALSAVVATATPLAKLHALWTLEGMGSLTPDVVAKALAEHDPKVRAAAVRLADRSLAPQLSKLVDDPSIDVQIALAFALGPMPEGQDALAKLVTKAGKNLMVRDAAISGLRGRELEFLQALLATKTANPPEEIIGGLAQAVMNEHRAARALSLLALIAEQPANSPIQVALLRGASGKAIASPGPKWKLLYLEAQPEALTKLTASADANTKPLLAAFDSRVAWPNKPGVPPPPVIKPLTAAEQKLFDAGKVTYGMLCVGCHQPNGQGMEGLAPPLVDSEWVLGKAEMLPRILIHGLTGPLKVKGTNWSLEMPPIGAALTDEQLAGVLTYIRHEWEHTASPVTVEEVAKVRAQHKDRTKAWTMEELSKLNTPAARPPSTKQASK